MFHGTGANFDRYLLYKYQSLSSIDGIQNMLFLFIVSIAMALSFVFIVQRAKLCLDFGVTVGILHFIVGLLYNDGSLPPNLEFYFIHLSSVGIMVLLGEYLCSRIELQEIPLYHSKNQVGNTKPH